MSLLSSDASVLVRPNFTPAAADLVFQEADFINYMVGRGRSRGALGDSKISWGLIHTANGSDEAYVENQALPTSGKREYAKCELEPFYVWARGGVTGHARDRVRNGGTYQDLIADQVKGVTAAVMYRAEQILWGATQDQSIPAIVDSSGIYANVNASSVTSHSSLETTTVGTLDIADLRDHYVDQISAPRAANPATMEILSSIQQMANYGATGVAASSTVLYRSAGLPYETGKGVDMGTFVPGLAYNGIPFRPVRTMAETELYWLDFGSDADDLTLVVVRDLTVEQLAKVNDNNDMLGTMALMLKVKNRRKQGKMTGIT